LKTVIIGAQGFVGQRLTKHLLASEQFDRLVLIDKAAATEINDDPRLDIVAGDFAALDLFDTHIAGASTVYLLASILGGAAEANYALARQVNIDATLTLLERLRDSNPQTRLVFASTIAVFGKPMPALVTDATPTGPTMVYGAQKLMTEIAIANFAARGWLDGVSLRLAGVMALDGADARMRSAFISRLFYAVMRSEDIVLPVHPHSQTWLTSVETAASNFAHAGRLDAAALGATRAFTLPALCLSFEELVAALMRRFPESRARVTYQPDEDLVELFGSYPPIATQVADSLGFLRDLNADALVTRSF